MERYQCPVCKNHALIKTNNAYSCALCGYMHNKKFEKNEEKNIKIASNEENEFYKINQIAHDFFQERLVKTREKKVKKYLSDRGFSTLEEYCSYGLGYDDGFLKQYLMNLGYTEQQIYYYGLTKYNSDFFKDRITIAIKDSLGRIVGFGARTIDGDDLKYINTSENPIFKKKMIFFGIHKLDFNKPIILCEGYFDTISLLRENFNALATMGTAMTIEHAILLKEIGQPIYLMYDSDAAGQKATIKNMQLLQSVGVPCKWVNLEDCKDPDEFLIKKGREKLKENIIYALNRKEAVLNNLNNSSMFDIVNYLMD